VDVAGWLVFIYFGRASVPVWACGVGVAGVSWV
jgi:hypothetical protein